VEVTMRLSALAVVAVVKKGTKRPDLLALALLTVVLPISLAVRSTWRSAGQEPPGMEHWDLRQLQQHLQEQGLEVKLVPVENTAVVTNRGYLTTTDKGWEELDPVPKYPEAIDRWQGTVYCERQHGVVLDAQLETWGDCCLWVGPFLLFGDRALMRDVHRLCAR
jgi:hypothetical protein